MSRLREDRRLGVATAVVLIALAGGALLLFGSPDGPGDDQAPIADAEPDRVDLGKPGVGHRAARLAAERAARRSAERRQRRGDGPQEPARPASRRESRSEIGGTPAGDPARPAGAGEVLVVGDSLEVATSPYLEAYLPGVPLTVDAVKSASSTAILGFLRRSYLPSHSVVVFDAGTNDDPAFPENLATNLAAAAELVGRRCLIVPTVQRPPFNGVGPGAINDTIRRFAASRPRTEVPDWAGAVRARPELLEPDGVHPTAAGAEERARLVAAAVSACLGSS